MWEDTLKLRQFLYSGIVGIFCLLLSQPAFAEEKQTEKQIDIDTEETSVEEKTEKSISQFFLWIL